MYDEDHVFKILIIGDSSVGKSNLLLRFTDNVFHDAFLPTIGVDFKIQTVNVGNKKIKLNIWDTAGQERFKVITSSYYKGAQGVVLTYDITDKESFDHISDWLQEVHKHTGKGSNVKTILVGNKCDLEDKREVKKEEGQAFADSQGMSFIETSAKEKINVDEVFIGIAKQIYQTQPNIGQDFTGGESLNKVKRKNKQGCCQLNQLSKILVQLYINLFQNILLIQNFHYIHK